MEQTEYTSEGINWEHIEFIDNQEILDMIGLRPLNIMSLIDEETKFPRGTDLSLLEKLHASHGTKVSTYVRPKSLHIKQFGIQHYAGLVNYNPNGFLEKNRDSISLDLKEMISQSSNKYLIDLFPLDELSNDTSKKSMTLSLQFRNSLDSLMKALSSCHPFFVRCIKPNETKQPNKFDKSLCVRQLRYSGIMETAKIRRSGYPIRHSYDEFVHRYCYLVTGLQISIKTRQISNHDAAKIICQKTLPKNSDFQLGLTKIFLKDSDDIILEYERSRVYLKYILIIQRSFRCYLFKKWLKLHRESVILIQKTWRRYYLYKKFIIIRKGFYRLQGCIKSRQLVYEFTMKRSIILKIQTFGRGFLARKKLQKLKQSHVLKLKEENEFKQLGKTNWKELAQENYAKRFEEISSYHSLEISHKSYCHDDNNDDENSITSEDKIISREFDFLYSATPSDSPTPPPSTVSIGDPYSHHHPNHYSVIKEGTNIKSHSEDLSEYKFEKFAVTYFITNNISHKYSRRVLKESLLEHDLLMDKIAAQAIWITILRFMGDMTESKHDRSDENDLDENSLKDLTKTPIMQNLTATLSKAFNKSKVDVLYQLSDKLNQYDGSQRQKLINKTLKRKTKIPPEISQSSEYYEKWLNTRSSSLEKLHFIIGHGILRAELRDEIFCQICKQLVDNPYHISFAKGWILLSLCLGCFAPSKIFEKYLRNFIRNGPQLYSSYCENRLDRTLKNGPRTQPPSWLELCATRNKNSIKLNVILMDGCLKKLQVDSGSTSSEAIHQLCKDIGISDSFGFSIVITLFDKVMSLGCGQEHIMDAISNCEQYTKEQNRNEKTIFWKLYLRKEIFSPWYDPSIDELATSLIYKQIVRGINFGEYICKRDIDIIIISVLQYYADNGPQMDKKLLRKLLPDYLPKDLLILSDKELNKWEELIVESFEKNEYVRNKVPQKHAREDIVIFAKINWPMMFSRFFETFKIDGPHLDTNEIILAVNWKGVFFIDKTEQILIEFDYAEIISVSYKDDEPSNINGFEITTIYSDCFKFKCYDSKDLCYLVNLILDNLKSLSTYVVAKQNSFRNFSDLFPRDDKDEEYLQFNRGDLIILDKSYNCSMIKKNENQWLRGQCNGTNGLFPTESVQILSTIVTPKEKILEHFKSNYDSISIRNKDSKSYKKRIDYNTLKRQKLHTLRKFGVDNFRSNIELPNLSQTIFVARIKKEELWKHTRDPIKAPLLKKLQNDKNLFEISIGIFINILKFMKDLPHRKTSINTNLIFQDAIKNENLRDEVYCQIMRQLTENPNQLSEENGWNLMWLATGIMFPSSIVLKELIEFLKTRNNYHPLATESLKRLQNIISLGPRKHPPYIIEVDAIQNRAMKIYHKIYFPDETNEAFEIQSTTRCHDLIIEVSKRFNLKTLDGFNLFIKFQDKAFSIPEDDYLFDFITDILLWLKDTMPSFRQMQDTVDSSATAINFQYQLIFMKKLWINIIPGKDINADVIFYYPQEIYKYLSSCYKITKNDAIKMASLILQANYLNEDLKQILDGNFLQKLIPKDIIPLRKFYDWKRDILSNLKSSEISILSSIEAKTEFLKEISKQSTFGSTFFVVEQSNDQNLPKIITIAVNLHGFYVIDSVTKEILMKYDYSELNFWSSGNTYFHIRFGNMIGASKLLCTTTQGYKIDDLISSYIKRLYPNLQ